LSASANESNGADKYQDSERGSSTGTESRGCSAPLEAENQPQAGPSFEDITPVPILNPPPKQRKKTAAVLTDKEHLIQAKIHR
jgi:hypothetical protein